VAVSDAAGTVTHVNSYDEYGKPAATNVGRFQYTGQTWLPELGLYYYKARIYDPTLGRFLQPDPIGYGDGMNMYAYVGGDPVNVTDPSGLSARKKPRVICTGSLIASACGPGGGIAYGLSGSTTAGPGGQVAGYFVKVNAGGPGVGSDTDFEVTASKIWISESWAFDGINYTQDIVRPVLNSGWDKFKKGANVVRCVVGKSGVNVDEAGRKITEVGVSIAIVGGAVGIAGIGTGQPEFGVLGGTILQHGLSIMAAGGLTSLVGTGMRAIGGDDSAFTGRGAVTAAGKAIPNPAIRAGTTHPANELASPRSEGIPACA
jgi:RHS repeat-associated protein